MRSAFPYFSNVENRPLELPWKTVLLLCIPGLIAGAILRVWLLSTIPEAYYGPDGGSYWHTAVRLWTEGNLSMVDKRRWLYPAFLCLLPMLPASPIQAIAVLQHALGLLMIFGGGMIVSRCTKFPKIWIPPAALALATWPQTLWLEHSLETETCLVATFMAVVWIGLSPTPAFSARRLFWFLLAAALVAAWKPHGRGIWLACLLVAIWKNGDPRRWARRCWAAIIFAVVVMASSGSSGQGNWLLLNSVLPLVPLQGTAFPAERAALQPLLLEARSVRNNYPWEQENFKYRLNSTKPEVVSADWSAIARDGKRFSKICRAFAFEALRAEPLAFVRFTLQKIGISLSENGYTNRLEPKKFWRAQNEENSVRWKKRLKEMNLLYRMDAVEYTQLARHRAEKTSALPGVIRHIAQGWGWFRENSSEGDHSLGLRLSGWLALGGLLVCGLGQNLKKFSVIWLPAAFYTVTVYAVGDRIARYAYPLNWLGVILVAVFFDQLLQLISTFMKTGSTAQQSAPPTPPPSATLPDASRRSATSFPANPFSHPIPPR